jgi:hypothetical protein
MNTFDKNVVAAREQIVASTDEAWTQTRTTFRASQ